MLCTVNYQIYRGKNDRAKPTTAVRGNRTRDAGMRVQHLTDWASLTDYSGYISIKGGYFNMSFVLKYNCSELMECCLLPNELFMTATSRTFSKISVCIYINWTWLTCYFSHLIRLKLDYINKRIFWDVWGRDGLVLSTRERERKGNNLLIVMWKVIRYTDIVWHSNFKISYLIKLSDILKCLPLI